MAKLQYLNWFFKPNSVSVKSKDHLQSSNELVERTRLLGRVIYVNKHIHIETYVPEIT